MANKHFKMVDGGAVSGAASGDAATFQPAPRKGQELAFTEPTFFQRIKAMLGVDFYRLIHTPMFYIFLAFAAMIPGTILATMGSDGGMYSSAWQMIAADSPLYVVRDMGDYANMNMVFIFGGIMVSIFIGNDYRSGYVKQLFTTHAKKQDYVISKALTGAFAMSCMCLTYLLVTFGVGMAVGVSLDVSVGSLVLALLGKVIMSLGWSALYTFLNVIFRRYFGISVASCFFLGTGVPVIGAAAILGNSALLNVFIYGSSVNACLSATPLTLVTCAVVSAAWFCVYTALGTRVLNTCDVY